MKYRGRKIAELRVEHAEFIIEKRLEASDAVKLLEDHARRKMESERASNGALSSSLPLITLTHLL